MPYLQRTFVREDKVSLLAFVVRPPAVAGNQIFFSIFLSLETRPLQTLFFFNFDTEFKFYTSTNLTLSTLSKLLIQAECLDEMIAYSTQS